MMMEMMCDPYGVVVILWWIIFSINMRPRRGIIDEKNNSSIICDYGIYVRPLRCYDYFVVYYFFYKPATLSGPHCRRKNNLSIVCDDGNDVRPLWCRGNFVVYYFFL